MRGSSMAWAFAILALTSFASISAQIAPLTFYGTTTTSTAAFTGMTLAAGLNGIVNSATGNVILNISSATSAYQVKLIPYNTFFSNNDNIIHPNYPYFSTGGAAFVDTLGNTYNVHTTAGFTGVFVTSNVTINGQATISTTMFNTFFAAYSSTNGSYGIFSPPPPSIMPPPPSPPGSALLAKYSNNIILGVIGVAAVLMSLV